MPFIFDNKTAKLVDCNENPLEFVTVRKLRIESRPDEELTIDGLKSAFRKFGSLERIEIFKVESTKARFAHITFKQDVYAYLAMLEMGKDGSLLKICPANTSLQPDNALPEMQSPFQSLNEDCLIKIFKRCGLVDQATLYRVCGKFSDILKRCILPNVKKFEIAGRKPILEKSIEKASAIIRSVNSKEFELKIVRQPQLGCYDSFKLSIEFGGGRACMEIAYDYIAEHTELLASSFGPFIECILITKTFYDTSKPAKAVEMDYPKLREFHHVATTRLKRFSTFYLKNTPQLHTISFRNGIFGRTELCDYYFQTNSIRRIIFRNCSLSPDLRITDLVETLQYSVYLGDTVIISWDSIDAGDCSAKDLQDVEDLITTMNQNELCQVFLDIGGLIS